MGSGRPKLPPIISTSRSTLLSRFVRLRFSPKLHALAPLPGALDLLLLLVAQGIAVPISRLPNLRVEVLVRPQRVHRLDALIGVCDHGPIGPIEIHERDSEDVDDSRTKRTLQANISSLDNTTSSKQTDPAEIGNTHPSTNHLPHSLSRVIKERIGRILLSGKCTPVIYYCRSDYILL